MITWDQITAECEGYRAGFVAVYEKYKGQTTDERDKSDRVVKVTVSSFARHMGIAETTFKRWVKGAKQVVTSEERARMEAPRAKKTKQDVRRMPTEDRAEVLGELLQDNTVVEERGRQVKAGRSLPKPNPKKPANPDTTGTKMTEAGILVIQARALAQEFIGVVQGFNQSNRNDLIDSAAATVDNWTAALQLLQGKDVDKWLEELTNE